MLPFVIGEGIVIKYLNKIRKFDNNHNLRNNIKYRYEIFANKNKSL
jgi:hypothetical protein